MDAHFPARMKSLAIAVAAIPILGFPVIARAAQTSGTENALRSDASEDAVVKNVLGDAVRLTATLSDEERKAAHYETIAALEWRSGDHDAARAHFDLEDRILRNLPQDDWTRVERKSANWARARAGDIEGAIRNLCNCRMPGSGDDERDLVMANAMRYEGESGQFAAAAGRFSLIRSTTVRDGAIEDLIGIALSMGKFEDALSLTGKMDDVPRRITSLNGIAISLFKHKHRKEASSALLESQLLASKFLDNSSDSEEGQQLDPPSSKSSQKSSISFELAVTESEMDDFSSALEIAENLPAGEERDSALFQIARKAAGKGNVAVVRQVDAEIREPQDRAAMKVILILAIAKSGDQKTSLALAQKDLDLATESQALINIAQVSLDKTDRNSALSFLERASQLANASSDRRTRVGLFWQIARMQRRAGDKAAAAQSLSNIGPKDFGWRWIQELLEEQVRAGDVQSALENARLSGCISCNLSTIAKQQAIEGDCVGALGWISTLTDAEEKISALTGLADGMLMPGHVEDDAE